MDLGERRIGLAFSDTAADWVFPAGYIQRTKLADLLRRVLHEAQTRQVDAFVVGVPYGRDGEAGPQAEKALGFARALEKQTTLPVHTIDERFTSIEAEGLLREAGRQPSRERAAVDETAAALILKRFLDQM
ncbi:MAG: Holliday junction resolvase RuvX [Chloroflexi bacterium]|nr:Holliday junction resolvase RuvX [Chloroflexota bacterium]